MVPYHFSLWCLQSDLAMLAIALIRLIRPCNRVPAQRNSFRGATQVTEVWDSMVLCHPASINQSMSYCILVSSTHTLSIFSGRDIWIIQIITVNNMTAQFLCNLMEMNWRLLKCRSLLSLCSQFIIRLRHFCQESPYKKKLMIQTDFTRCYTSITIVP